jgi:hypothetical protein
MYKDIKNNVRGLYFSFNLLTVEFDFMIKVFELVLEPTKSQDLEYKAFLSKD